MFLRSPTAFFISSILAGPTLHSSLLLYLLNFAACQSMPGSAKSPQIQHVFFANLFVIHSPRCSWQDGAYTVEGAITTDAGFSEVWKVLTDYAKLSHVFSNIRESSIASSSPEIVLKQVRSTSRFSCTSDFLTAMKLPDYTSMPI